MNQIRAHLFSHLVPEVPCSQRHLLPELQVAPFSHGGSQTGSAHVAPVALRGHSHWSGPTHEPPFRHANRHETAKTKQKFKRWRVCRVKVGVIVAGQCCRAESGLPRGSPDTLLQ